MAAVMKFCPFDPGSEDTHGCKSYEFWPTNNSATATPSCDNVDHSGNNRSSRFNDVTSAKALAQLYLFLRVFLHYFFEYIKRVAVTVKIYPALADCQKPQICLEPVAEKALVPKPTPISQPSLDDWKVLERNLGAGFLARAKIDANKLSATQCSTCVFEVLDGGLADVLKDINQEIRSIYWGMQKDKNSVLACCELVWSVPSKRRSYWTELNLEHEADRLMRSSDQVARSLFQDHPGEVMVLQPVQVQPGGMEQRMSCSSHTKSSSMGIYRRFYPTLIDMAKGRATEEHGKVWSFDPKPQPTDFFDYWPVVGGGDLSRTTVVFLNLIFLKFST